MEDVYCRFDSYDFESDAQFAEGVRSLQNSSRSEETLLDLKLFYYNRFVEPIDRSAYKHRGSSNGTSACSGDSQSVETEAAVLSFAEVMKLVQEGKEVPGVKKVDIQPSNQSPAPSQMQRILKPWERSPQAT
ncbi:unnamed protein product [Knipowitschia caucasica]|uniref:Uncharacterized protein n=1 Tax=Knipowitschia caucasica TaxID=637954 RepID=A0AAV2M077_KNICA